MADGISAGGDQETRLRPLAPRSLSRRCSRLLSISLRKYSRSDTPIGGHLITKHRSLSSLTPIEIRHRAPPSVLSVIHPRRSVLDLHLPGLRATSSSSTYTRNAHDQCICPRAATAGHVRDTTGPGLGAPEYTATRPRQARSAPNGILRRSWLYSRAPAYRESWQRRCFVSISPPLVPLQPL